MSQSHISLGGETLWFRDEPFAIWLRVMALNLKACAIAGLSTWESEVAESWLRQSQLIGISNVLGVDFDDELSTVAQVLAVYATSKKVSRVISEVGPSVSSSILELLGFTGSAAAEVDVAEILEIGERLFPLFEKKFPNATPRATGA